MPPVAIACAILLAASVLLAAFFAKSPKFRAFLVVQFASQVACLSCVQWGPAYVVAWVTSQAAITIAACVALDEAYDEAVEAFVRPGRARTMARIAVLVVAMISVVWAGGLESFGDWRGTWVRELAVRVMGGTRMCYTVSVGYGLILFSILELAGVFAVRRELKIRMVYIAAFLASQAAFLTVIATIPNSAQVSLYWVPDASAVLILVGYQLANRTLQARTLRV